MRLVDVESSRHPSNRNDPAAGPAEAAASAATEPTAAFALHAVAKFLNPFLQILFAPSAKVLRPSLRAADAHRLRWSLRSRSVQRKT